MHIVRLAGRLFILALFAAFLTVWLERGGRLPVAPNAMPAGHDRYMAQAVAALWWILVALTIGTVGALGDAAVNRLRGQGQRRASFAVHAIWIAAFGCAALGMASFVFELPVSAIFATSSIVAVVLGFALQATLSDLLSGIALNVEKPFRIGHWVAIGDNAPGRVVEMNWRATRIQPKSGDLVVYPNSMLTRTRIVNFDAPARSHRVTFEIKLDNDESPMRAEEILQAATLSAVGVKRDPPPSVEVASFGDWSISYRVIFWIDDFSTENAVLSRVLKAIWTHLSWAGISRPIPTSYVSVDRPRAEDEREELARLLARMPVFKPLAESERLYLASMLRPSYAARGSRLIAQGEEGRSLFIIREGLFRIRVTLDGTERDVAELHPGDYFGEASLLTGAPRNASVEALTDGAVFELDKAAVADLLAKRSEVAEELARALADREAERSRAQESTNGAVATRRTLAEAAGLIRTFLLG